MQPVFILFYSVLPDNPTKYSTISTYSSGITSGIISKILFGIIFSSVIFVGIFVSSTSRTCSLSDAGINFINMCRMSYMQTGRMSGTRRSRPSSCCSLMCWNLMSLRASCYIPPVIISRICFAVIIPYQFLLCNRDNFCDFRICFISYILNFTERSPVLCFLKMYGVLYAHFFLPT